MYICNETVMNYTVLLIDCCKFPLLQKYCKFCNGMIYCWVSYILRHFFLFFNTFRHNRLEGHFIMFLSWFETNMPLTSLTETRVELVIIFFILSSCQLPFSFAFCVYSEKLSFGSWRAVTNNSCRMKANPKVKTNFGWESRFDNKIFLLLHIYIYLSFFKILRSIKKL